MSDVTHFLLLLFISSKTNGLRCMTPEDARLITTACEIPPNWLRNGWHTGPYMADNRHVNSTSQTNKRGVFFTTTGTRLFWLKHNHNRAYYVMTQDKTRLLCAHTVGGVGVSWLESSNRDQDQCLWIIEVDPTSETKFRMKNYAFNQTMPEVGYAYFDETGIYFDYEENARNDARNILDESRRWFEWRKASPWQRDFATIQEECLLNDLAICSSGWYLFGTSCYKAVTGLAFTQANTKQVCHLLQSELVTPRSQQEQSFLVRFLRLIGSKQKFWLGIERKSTGKRFYDLQGNPLMFRRWTKRLRSFFETDKCVYWYKRRWFPSNCDSKRHLLCKREAKLRNSISCGKIQQQRIDEVMEQAANPPRIQSRIVNGYSAEEGQFPWQASLRFKNPMIISGEEVYHNCGGTLIDECWVVTAAHCVPERDPSIFIVRLGDLNNEWSDGTEQEFHVSRVIVHEEYSLFPSPRFDIALLKLRSKQGKCASFTDFVQPACLSRPTSRVVNGQRCHVSGWGITNYTIGQASSSTNLQWTTLPRLSDVYCRSKYNMKHELFINNIMLCAGLKEGGRDACTGDSGGPYVCRNKQGIYDLIGIVSFGIGCAESSHPGVFTNVAYFVTWINEKIRANGGGKILG